MKNIRDLYRGISHFKKGYRPRTDIVKDEKGDLVADSHSILSTWRKYFSQILNVHGVNDVRQRDILVHTAEPLVPEPSASEVELDIEKLKSHKSPGIGQIPAQMIKVGGTTMHYEIHNIIYIWNKEELGGEWRSRSLYLPIRRAIKQILVIIGAYQFCQQCTKFHPTSCSKG